MRSGLLLILIATLALAGGALAGLDKARAAGLSMQKTAAVWQFTVPGSPATKLVTAVASSQTPPFLITLSDASYGLLPGRGHLLLGNAELVAFDDEFVACPEPDWDQACVTQRAVAGQQIAHPAGTQVKLATRLTAPLSGVNVASSALNTLITVGEGLQEKGTQCDGNADDDGDGKVNDGCPAVDGPDAGTVPLAETGSQCDDAVDANEEGGPDKVNDGCPVQINNLTAPFLPTNPLLNPFKITLASTANFPVWGEITISHQDTDAGGAQTEYLWYDNELGGCTAVATNELCIRRRAQQANGVPSAHPANGYAQGGGTPGQSLVELHRVASVTSNGNFFSEGRLLIFELAGGAMQNAEVIAYNNAAASVITVLGGEFYMTDRGGPASTFKKTAVVAHPAGSIVTGADESWVCRAGHVQPMDVDPVAAGVQEPAGQVAGTSVAAYPVCYVQSQPNGAPKTLNPNQLNVPLVGHPLIALNAVSPPFFSTGGFTHPLYGSIPQVDRDGTQGDVNDCDGDGNTTELLLCLTSACVKDYEPGVNLQMKVWLNVDKGYATADSGLIAVVRDSVLGPAWGPDGNWLTHDECDDREILSGIPTAPSALVATTYDAIGGNDPTGDGDDDTDGDGCDDQEELQPNQITGGRRDPWNPYDFYDVDGNKVINVFGDINPVVAAYGDSSGPNYSTAKDRGTPKYGPYDHNRPAGDGVINVFDDILVVAGQFGNDCSAS